MIKQLENQLRNVRNATKENSPLIHCITKQNGVWLSLARAPGLGPGGRRFESCHPDLREQRVKVRACMRT